MNHLKKEMVDLIDNIKVKNTQRSAPIENIGDEKTSVLIKLLGKDVDTIYQRLHQNKYNKL